MSRTITFIASENTNEYKYLKNEIIHGYAELTKAILEGKEVILTTQMALMSTRLITDHNYRIVVVESNNRRIEIKLGENENTGRYIKEGHNIFKLWQGGEFDDN